MATLLRVSKKQALELAQASTSITVTDRDADWENKPVSYAEMIDLIKEFGHYNWWATQFEGTGFFSIDTRSRMHFEITL